MLFSVMHSFVKIKALSPVKQEILSILSWDKEQAHPSCHILYFSLIPLLNFFCSLLVLHHSLWLLPSKACRPLAALTTSSVFIAKRTGLHFSLFCSYASSVNTSNSSVPECLRRFKWEHGTRVVLRFCPSSCVRSVFVYNGVVLIDVMIILTFLMFSSVCIVIACIYIYIYIYHSNERS